MTLYGEQTIEHYIEDFLIFLDEYGADVQFVINLHSARDMEIKAYLYSGIPTRPDSFIFSAFNWAANDEGDQYWRELHILWCYKVSDNLPKATKQTTCESIW